MILRDQKLDACGCCEEILPLTPLSLANQPGLTALAYRVGTHGSFKISMKAALARQRALSRLTTRDDDDPSIALLDSWATVLDVLTFYQERLANEGFLRTATERRSLLELARSIGYELNPGVAASTYLAFTLDPADGAPQSAMIDVGTKVQSVPEQGETAQTFETVEQIEARVEWNSLRPRQTAPQALGFGDTSVYLKGTGTNLKTGDVLLVVGRERRNRSDNERWEFRRVASVIADSDHDRTLVSWDEPLGHRMPRVEPPDAPEVYALRTRASLFGYNAPRWETLAVSLRVGEISPETNQFVEGPFHDRRESWADAKFAAGTSRINLDSVYGGVIKDSWAVLSIPSYAELYEVTAVAEETKADFTLSAKTTLLQLRGENITLFSPRTTTVFGQSEFLEMAETPLSDALPRNHIQLNISTTDLVEGQVLAFTGKDSLSGETVSEMAILREVSETGGLTTLHLERDLEHELLRSTVIINANVAAATHGESKKETLGSGNSADPFQKFVLKQSPLTHVPAATAKGSASTLTLRVNDLQWEERESLYRAGSRERIYTSRLSDDGKTAVEFGDGVHGARPPTGTENITAAFRVGIGTDGNLKAGQLTLLMTRPPGVSAVSNPTPATGGANPESRDEARQNGPLTILTLDRIVSLQDFEDFARAFAGVGKSQARYLWNGSQRLVHVTVAGVGGADIPEDSVTHRNLRNAIQANRHAVYDVQVDNFDSLTFALKAEILAKSEYDTEDVLACVTSALEKAFSFDARGFGQPVTESEAMAVMQGVEGVEAVKLEALHLVNSSASKSSRLPARIARLESGVIQPAEMLTIASDAITLTPVTS